MTMTMESVGVADKPILGDYASARSDAEICIRNHAALPAALTGL